METRLKVIQGTEVTTDGYIQDSSKWTLFASPGQTKNKAVITNNDLNLALSLKSSYEAYGIVNGVTLDPTKKYVIQTKLNSKALSRSKAYIAGIDVSNYPVGKEITRVVKPVTTELKIKLQVTSPSPGLSSLFSNYISFDYLIITEYDVSYLDLRGDEPILYQSNIKDIYEPDKVKSDYTKDFDIPGTPNNNRFFNHWYRVTAKGEFDVTARTPVIIMKKETELVEGYMILNNVELNGSDIKYNVSIIAEVANIWQDIDTLKIKDLDWSQYDHAINMVKMYYTLPLNGTVQCGPTEDPTRINEIYTFESIKTGASSLLTMPNGTKRVKITLTNHGYSEGDFLNISTFVANNPSIRISELTGQCVVEGVFDANNFYINRNWTFTATSGLLTSCKRVNFTGKGWYYGAINRGHTTKNIMTPAKSKPSFFIKGVIDQIFKEAGYKYSSEFLNTNYFKSLLVELTTKEITQTTDDMGSAICEVKNTYDNLDKMLKIQQPKEFIKDAYFGTKIKPGICGSNSDSMARYQLVTDYAGIAYGSEYSYDLYFNTEVVDQKNMYSNGTFTPAVNGEYKFTISLTVGISRINWADTAQFILPETQKFEAQKHIPGVWNVYDKGGLPASTGLWVYNSGVELGNSGIVCWIELQDTADNSVVWSSTKYIAGRSGNRSLGRFSYQDDYVDIVQEAGVSLKKAKSYKLVLKYKRNQKLLFGSESNQNNPYRWGWSYTTCGIINGIPDYFTDQSSPISFGAKSWRVYLIGSGQTAKMASTPKQSGVTTGTTNVTGLNYVKMELLQTVAEGSDVRISSFLAEMDQSEFLASVNKMFNLYWLWDKNNKQYIIEPFYNFYTQDELDWTKKVDIKSPIQMEPLENKKKYILGYKDTNDYYNEDYRKAFGYNYGDSVVVNASDIAKDDQEMKSSFGLGVLVQFPVKPLNTMIIPTYSSQNLGSGVSNDSPSNDSVRVYMCGGLQYSKTPMRLDDGTVTNQTWESTDFTLFPFAGHIDSTYAPYYDLCFANPAQFSYIMSNYTTHNLYNKFWRDWFSLILNKEQKLVTYKINLNDTDIFNLDYRKRYVINKEPFRLVSISDHNLTANNLATVTFIKDYGSRQYDPLVAASGTGTTITNGGGTDPNWPDIVVTPWVEDEWNTRPWRSGWLEDYTPNGIDYNPIRSYSARSDMNSPSSLTTAQWDNNKDRSSGSSAQFDSISMGDSNMDIGGENYITGRSNRVYSRGSFISGVNNQVEVSNAIVMGDNITAKLPGIYFQDVFVDDSGLVHNATNVFNGGSNLSTNYYESVNNLYEPNVLGAIGRSGATSSPTNPYGGVLEIDNPYIQFTRINGYDIRHDAYINNY